MACAFATLELVMLQVIFGALGAVFALLGAATPFLFILDGYYHRQILKGVKLTVSCLSLMLLVPLLMSMLNVLQLLGLCMLLPVILFALCFRWAHAGKRTRLEFEGEASGEP